MFLVLIPHYWGKAPTALEASNIALAQSGKKKRTTLAKPRIVFEFDPAKTPECYVDDMGALCWTGERPVEIEKVLK